MSVGFILLQAVHMGLACHPMGGFSVDRIRELFNLPPEIEPVSMLAIGRPGDPEKTAEEVKNRQFAPRTRNNLEDILL